MLAELVMGHAVADFALQSEAMAKGKNWRTPYAIPWPYWLTAHALIHGAAVTVVTGSVTLGLCETAAHWLIDLGKCSNKYGIHIDQALHLACKVAWWMAVRYV